MQERTNGTACEAPGRQERTNWTPRKATREAPGRQERTSWTAWEDQGGRKGLIGQPARHQGGRKGPIAQPGRLQGGRKRLIGQPGRLRRAPQLKGRDAELRGDTNVGSKWDPQLKGEDAELRQCTTVMNRVISLRRMQQPAARG